MTLDIALAIEAIIPAAQYSGSVTANTEESYNLVVWHDKRVSKPTWAELEESWKDVQLIRFVSDFTDKIQNRLDDFVRTLTYDCILSACTYATSTVEMYRVEGQYCVTARDTTWSKAFDIMQDLQAKIEAGDDVVITWEEVEKQLPELKWPVGSRGYVGKK